MDRASLLCCMAFFVGCGDPQPVEFENETYDVYVIHVVQTMERLNIYTYEDISCEDLCFTLAGVNTREYNITECSSVLDDAMLEDDPSTLELDLLVGTVTCSGSVLNFEK